MRPARSLGTRGSLRAGSVAPHVLRSRAVYNRPDGRGKLFEQWSVVSSVDAPLRPFPKMGSILGRILMGLVLITAGVLAVVAWMLGPDWRELAWIQFPYEFRRRAAFLYLDAL